ncbi:hypothetical protein AQUCO_01100300v1 [Aquilegia coerulea]|uniref:Uncharacterized protein n=1 Tax=Aquilegia coerulea TaxID=218851 RepID=A0A2G5E6I2_AQUCA|nr:hypothetical protein AQUCO_01100300v1 [Aquilegia coerulea]
MVSKVVLVDEIMNKRQQPQQEKNKGNQHQQKQIMQCNKGKASKFKRSCFNGEEDGASSAILLLACIALAP